MLKSKEYRWCPMCSGIILINALYCRHCKRQIIEAEQQKQRQQQREEESWVKFWILSRGDWTREVADAEEEAQRGFNTAGPNDSLKDVRIWLTSLKRIVDELPDSNFKLHILSVMEHGCKSTTEVQIPEKSWERITVDKPPADEVMHLIQELLLMRLKEGSPMDSILDTPKIQILDITFESLQAEFNKRELEELSQRSCTYCAESIAIDAVRCRFCGSDFIRPPQYNQCKNPRQKLFLGRFDSQLLHEVILYIAVNYALAEFDWQTMLSLPLQNCAITAEEIEESLKQRRYLIFEGTGVDIPRSQWQKRLMQYGLANSWRDITAIKDIINLGKYCATEERFEESEIILLFALALIEGDTALKGPLLDPFRADFLQDCYMTLSRSCEAKKDFVNAEKYAKLSLEQMVAAPLQDTFIYQRRQARLCSKQGKYAEAERLYLEILRGIEQEVQHLNQTSRSLPKMDRALIMNELAETYLARQQWMEARNALAETLTIAQELKDTMFGRSRIVVLVAAQKYIELCGYCNKYYDEQAELYFRKVLEVLQSSRTCFTIEFFNECFQNLLNAHTTCLEKLGRMEKTK